MTIFLSGPMGSGKSTVGRALAAAEGVELVDLDARIAERAGRSIQEIFQEQGEGEFRRLERQELQAVLDEDSAGVVSLGGGTVTDRDSRRLLLERGFVVTLTASVEALTRRVADETGRPLLSGRDARDVLRELLASRHDAYSECHATVDTTSQSAEDVVAQVRAVASQRRVVVPLGARTYRAEIGVGVRSRLAERLTERGAGKPTFVVTDENVEGHWARALSGQLQDHGLHPVRTVLAAGEAHKTSESIERLWDDALEAGVDRTSFVIAIGGGVVGDLAGFAASTLLRGLRFAQVPTTVLAMVDAAVGGKTGFDRRQGKNLVGTFHQPAFVLCDVETLSTLPDRERIAGLAEVVKSAWLESEAAVAAIEADAEALVAGDAAATARAVEMALRLKARIVAADEREGDLRRLLNLGHTVGHAIEAQTGYTELLHGEAVSLGLVAAFRVGATLGHRDDDAAERMTRLLGSLGLPVDVERWLRPATFDYLRADKKRTGPAIRFVVPRAPGQVTQVPVEIDSICAALSG